MKLKDVKVGDSFIMEEVTIDSGKIRLSPDDGQLICDATNLILFDMNQISPLGKGGILLQLHSLNWRNEPTDNQKGTTKAPFIFRRVEFKQEGPLATILHIDTSTNPAHFREDLNFEVGGYLRGDPLYPSWHKGAYQKFWFLKSYSPLSFLNWINENPLEVK